MVSVDSWWDGLVRDRSAAILELVLDTMADDYESLETILLSLNEWGDSSDLEAWPAARAIPVSRAEVIRALRELTDEGYAQSYILDTKEPFAKPVEFQKEQVDDLWFYVSPKGANALKQLHRRIGRNA